MSFFKIPIIICVVLQIINLLCLTCFLQETRRRMTSIEKKNKTDWYLVIKSNCQSVHSKKWYCTGKILMLGMPNIRVKFVLGSSFNFAIYNLLLIYRDDECPCCAFYNFFFPSGSYVTMKGHIYKMLTISPSHRCSLTWWVCWWSFF